MNRSWNGFAVLTATAAATVLAMGGCSSTQSESAGSARSEPLTVMAAFYPLQFAAEQVGGEAVAVESLTPAGAEPHDIELSPQQVAELGEADLILYIKGFQPAVDEAIAQVAPDKAVDVSSGIPLLKGTEPSEEEGNTGEEVSATDPHIWLDPLNMVTIGRTIASRLADIDSGQAATFTQNADALGQQMDSLDQSWRTQTQQCDSRDLVVSHEAFGYLAERYNFEQVGISGLTPDAEPVPSRVAEVTDFVKKNNVKTIYFETLVDPKVAETVASETGAVTAVLDPLEGLPEGSSQTYLTVMESNLATVVAGQPCS